MQEPGLGRGMEKESTELNEGWRTEVLRGWGEGSEDSELARAQP